MYIDIYRYIDRCGDRKIDRDRGRETEWASSDYNDRYLTHPFLAVLYLPRHNFSLPQFPVLPSAIKTDFPGSFLNCLLFDKYL